MRILLLRRFFAMHGDSPLPRMGAALVASTVALAAGVQRVVLMLAAGIWLLVFVLMAGLRSRLGVPLAPAPE